MNDLENKIREALPRLKEIGVGLKFIDKLDFKAEIVYENVGTYYFFSESDNEIFSASSNFFGGICKEIIGHPIKLNDVLEYLNSKSNIGFGIYSNGIFIKWKEKAEEYYEIKNNEGGSIMWDLSSVFLADQSEELKKYLNNL